MNPPIVLAVTSPSTQSMRRTASSVVTVVSFPDGRAARAGRLFAIEQGAGAEDSGLARAGEHHRWVHELPRSLLAAGRHRDRSALLHRSSPSEGGVNQDEHIRPEFEQGAFSLARALSIALDQVAGRGVAGFGVCHGLVVSSRGRTRLWTRARRRPLPTD
jgi:hypothetical protein